MTGLNSDLVDALKADLEDWNFVVDDPRPLSEREKDAMAGARVFIEQMSKDFMIVVDEGSDGGLEVVVYFTEADGMYARWSLESLLQSAAEWVNDKQWLASSLRALADKLES